MQDEKIRAALDAAREYLKATTEAFRSPRVQHTRRMLGSALADLDKPEPPAPRLSKRLERRFTAAQADGDAGQ